MIRQKLVIFGVFLLIYTTFVASPQASLAIKIRIFFGGGKYHIKKSYQYVVNVKNFDWNIYSLTMTTLMKYYSNFKNHKRTCKNLKSIFLQKSNNPKSEQISFRKKENIA